MSLPPLAVGQVRTDRIDDDAKEGLSPFEMQNG